MKKLTNCLAVILLTIIIIINCTGCTLIKNFSQVDLFSGNFDTEQLTEGPLSPKPSPTKDPHNYVKFYSEDDEIQKIFIDKKEIVHYETLYPECNGDFYKKQLSQEELIVYNSLLYAMEHNFSYIEMFIKDNSVNAYSIRELLSLDSPFLEQNYSPGESITISGIKVTFTFDRFNKEAWDLKMQALDKANKIIADMPENLTADMERMEYIYDYIRRNIKYSLYKDDHDANYLYDALCKGVTLCDGYSNALSLLFNLAGIKCCEVMGNSSGDEDYEAQGHTWVAAMIDGEYYNFDATSDAIEDNEFDDYRCFFAISDDLLKINEFDYDGIRPLCKNTQYNIACADHCFEDMSSPKTLMDAASLFDSRVNSGKMKTLLSFSKPFDEELLESFLDDFIQVIKSTDNIYYIPLYENGRTLLLLIA